MYLMIVYRFKGVILVGYSHGIKWDDSKITNEIIHVKNILGIDRMPTKSEIEFVTKSNSLSCKISKSGGFKEWAYRLNLEIKKSESDLGSKWEMYIKNILEARGYEISKMSFKHPYDLLVNNNIKVDVKVSSLYENEDSKYHSFNLEKKYHNCDIFILVALDEFGSPLKILIVPSKELMGQKQVSIGYKSKYDKFDSRFELIKVYDNFYNDLDCVM
ncbi:TPA: hypothetical protein KNP56_003561 [Clostridioides difficile]|nr:hypothetical protein [Clostridioides difficile]